MTNALLIAMAGLLPLVIGVAPAQSLYKCTVNGKIVYQGSPCDAGTQSSVDRSNAPLSPSEKAALDAKRDEESRRRLMESIKQRAADSAPYTPTQVEATTPEAEPDAAPRPRGPGYAATVVTAPTTVLAAKDNSLTNWSTFFLILAVLILIFLIAREIVCWYWKINQSVRLLTDIRDSLRELKTAQSSVVEQRVRACNQCGQWVPVDATVCPKCNARSPVSP